MVIAAILVFLTMWVAGRVVKRASGRAAAQGLRRRDRGAVLFVRNDIAIAEHRARRRQVRAAHPDAVLLHSVLNLLGLLPWGASATGNLAVTGALAILAFLVIEIGGFVEAGPQGIPAHDLLPCAGLPAAARGW